MVEKGWAYNNLLLDLLIQQFVSHLDKTKDVCH